MAVPTPPVPKGLSAGATKYLKQNWKFAYAGGLGLAFLGLDAAGIATADNKFKALLKTFKDFVLIRIAMVGLFTGVATAIKSLVRETGSLNEALKKFNLIQQYSRQFQTFTGSLGSAKQRISELYQLSLRKPFKFEDIVEANKSLEIFTRGAYSSVEATKTIGAAALATGNSVEDTARAVGVFYDQLRSGKPAGEAAEQLRQMGLISQSTSDGLASMSETGATAAETFDRLTTALEKTAQGAVGYKDELKGITEEHEKAVSELKKAFGAPFVEAESSNIKNRTAAYQAITPVVAKLSESAAGLYNGFSTAGSALTKFLLQSKFVQNALLTIGKGFMVVTVAAGIFGTLAAATLIPVLTQMSTGIAAFAGVGLRALGLSVTATATAVSGLETALIGLSYALPIAAVVGFGIAIAGAMIHGREEVKKIKKEFEDWSASQDKATESLLAQVAAITTLTDKHEALAAAMKRIIELQHIRNDLDDKAKHHQRDLSRGWEGTRGALGNEPLHRSPLAAWWARHITGAATRERVEGEQGKRAKIEQDIAKEAFNRAAKEQTVNKEAVQLEAQRRFEIEQQSIGARQRDTVARAGLEAQAKLEGRLGENDAKRVKAQNELDDARKRFEVREKRTPAETAAHVAKQLEGQQEITRLEKERQGIQLEAPEFSATAKEARASQLRHAKELKELEAAPPGEKATEDAKRKYKADVERARTLAGPEAIEMYGRDKSALHRAEVEAALATKREAAPPSPAEEREARVTELTTRAETKANELRRRGDIAQSQAVGDILSFTKSFESLRGSLGDQKAASVSLAKTQEDIAQEYVPASQITSSLAAVGGGGEVSKVDPELDSARRREAIQAEMLSVLKILAGQEPEQPAQPVYK